MSRVRYPVGLFFIRGERAGPGGDLAEQIVASFDYWNEDSGRYLDMVFPGWGKDGELIAFDLDAFHQCKGAAEHLPHLTGLP